MTETHQSFDVSRPKLCSSTPESEFLAWYWLKAELILFCRENELRTTGSKEELTERIAAFLGGRQELTYPPTKAAKFQHSVLECLTLQTVVTPGFRLSSKLRAFFNEHAGPNFHFNQVLRDFFREPNGRTLADALTLYRNSQMKSGQPIMAQFEYNRHMREFFDEHPGASMKEARLAWWHKRHSRKSR